MREDLNHIKKPKMDKDTIMSNKELIRRLYKEVLFDWNMELVDAVVSPEFRSHDWPKDGPTGPQAFRDFYSGIRSALPDAQYEIYDIITEDGRVVVGWRLLGTHKGNFRGIAATGLVFTLNGIAIYRLEGGTLMERWVETDVHRLLGEIQRSSIPEM
jgi:predicted ester cyclase